MSSPRTVLLFFVFFSPPYNIISGMFQPALNTEDPTQATDGSKVQTTFFFNVFPNGKHNTFWDLGFPESHCKRKHHFYRGEHPGRCLLCCRVQQAAFTDHLNSD